MKNISERAILIASNPYRNYIISPGRTSKEPGDVELHSAHLRQHHGVFWDIIPQGRRDKPWGHPEIHSGYFYIAGDKVVRYWIDIEYIKRWKDIELAKVEGYIPHSRKAYLQAYPEAKNYYAILIRDIHRLTQERKKEEFRLANPIKEVERVRNYAIIIDPGWR